MRSGLIAAILLALGLSLPASAREPRVARSYTIADPKMAEIDRACVSAAIEVLRPADGFNGLKLGFPVHWESTIPGLLFAWYRDVNFRSDHGDTSGGFICTTSRLADSVLEVAFTFDGSGFPGLRAPPGKPLGESRIGSFVSGSAVKISGAR